MHRHHHHHAHHDHTDIDPRRGRRHHGGFPEDHGFDEDDRRRGGGRGPRGPRGPRPEHLEDFEDPRGAFGGPRGGRERRGGGPHRAPRGDVRTAVLLLLNEEPMHGYQLMQTIAERTGGRWSPSPGAIYPTISQLEDEGLVSTAKEGGRKLASLTEDGRAHVAESSSSWSNPFPGPSGEGEGVDLRSLMFELRGAVREVGRAGTEAQIARAAATLEDARAQMYRILAGEADQAGGDAPAASAPAASAPADGGSNGTAPTDDGSTGATPADDTPSA